jgi:hypothetical protein
MGSFFTHQGNHWDIEQGDCNDVNSGGNIAPRKAPVPVELIG